LKIITKGVSEGLSSDIIKPLLTMEAGSWDLQPFVITIQQLEWA
jgi:hypothetical protein